MIVPTYSFIATAEAVSTVGATPVIVDIDPETALITAEIVERALTPKTRCVIPVHLFGRPVDMDPLLALCRERGIAVIEDACQAHGALYRGRPVGSLGDAGCFSFYPTKNLGGWGDGGALVTSDPALDAQGPPAALARRGHPPPPRAGHRHPPPRHPAGGDPRGQAAPPPRLEPAPPRRRRRAARGAGREQRHLPRPGGSRTATTSTTSSSSAAPQRDALRDHLDSRGIASAIHYPTPIHLQPAYADLGLGHGDLPVAERLASENCSLPIFPAIEDAQIAEIVAAVESFEVPADN